MKPSLRPLVLILGAVVVGSFASGLEFTATASQADAEFASGARPYLQNRAKSSAFSAAILPVKMPS
ncbi:MAG: hypothetical protein ACR2GK_09435 [Gemmatimonadaceae bacterium]